MYDQSEGRGLITKRDQKTYVNPMPKKRPNTPEVIKHPKKMFNISSKPQSLTQY